jgi:SPP1 gp7 family putative phage head morphogenesis protein
MPRHPDFEALYQKFISEYGTSGEQIYQAYIHNEGLKEEEAMPKRDAIEGNLSKVKRSISAYLETEKKRVSLIVDKYIDDYYRVGLQEVGRELSLTPSEFGDLRTQLAQRRALTDNAKQLAFNLYDDINKEIVLFLTDIELNNIPFTNQALKAEIQTIFEKKQARLQSQINDSGIQTFNTALEFGYKQSGLVSAKQWVAVIDDKTTTGCLALNGEIVELGQPFSLGVYTPPLHPNCRSRIQPITITQNQL